jgi:cytochrome c556
MKIKVILTAISLIVGASYVSAALAQAKPEQLVKQRKAAMVLIGKYWGPIGRMESGKSPYKAETVTRNAGYLAVLSKLPWDGFAESTKDVKSRALPEVFSDADKFKEAADKLMKTTAALAKVADGGSEAEVKEALGAVGKSCGGCHKNFRAKK